MFMNLLALLFFVAFPVGWWGIVRFLKSKGKSGFLVWVAGPLAGVASSFGVMIAGVIVGMALNIPMEAAAPTSASPSPQVAQKLTKAEEAKLAKQRAAAAQQALLGRIKELSSNIEDVAVSDGGSGVMIKHFQKTVWSEESMVVGASGDAARIIEALAKDKSNDLQKVALELYAPTTDKYGNEGKSLAMRWTYDMTEVRKINWDNFNSWDLMNFVEADFTPLGRSAAAAYCSDESKLQYTRDFCMQVLM